MKLLVRVIYFLCFYLIFIESIYSQNCFNDYDLLFEQGRDTLPYEDFHKLELSFLNNIRGCKAIDFSVTTIDGEDIVLSELRGKVVVLNFWFTTCLPCLKEIPELNKLVENNDIDDVIFIGFAREGREALVGFFEKYGDFKYKIVPNSYDVAGDYRVLGWPQSIVIDKDGNIYNSWIGVDKNPSELINEIQTSIDDCMNYDL